MQIWNKCVFLNRMEIVGSRCVNPQIPDAAQRRQHGASKRNCLRRAAGQYETGAVSPITDIPGGTSCPYGPIFTNGSRRNGKPQKR